MPRELITIQVGQCGNQIGLGFWSAALKEHRQYNKSGYYDEALSSFFRNVDSRYEDPVDIPVGNGKGKIKDLKARAILIDMEEGVVKETMKGTLGSLFDQKQFITDVSGSGNNWAHGHQVYGPQYRESLINTIRRTTEFCDSLQSFMLLHSLGGGTGSGLGTYILELLADEFPSVYRFSSCVFPSKNDDVVTSPYNSILSLWKLCEFADCVLPIENQALLRICRTILDTEAKSNQKGRGTVQGHSITQSYLGPLSTPSSSSSSPATITTKPSEQEKPFDMMNSIAGHLLLNLTSSMRFEGTLNVDLNEITMNLVPFPKLHFLVSALSPLYTLHDLSLPPRQLDQMFTDLFHPDYQLLKCDPAKDIYLACALMVRGEVDMSDIRRNIGRLQNELRFVPWNREGWKVGHCNIPAVGQKRNALALANNCCIRTTFQKLLHRFQTLYKSKAYVHHYTSFMDPEMFKESQETVTNIIGEYEHLAIRSDEDSEPAQRLVPVFH